MSPFCFSMTLILDALVVGSGALGCATAFYLTEAGVRRVGVVDRGPLVSGMTRRNAGLVHTHHSSSTTTRLATQSLDTYRHWAGMIGGSCGFVETGTLITVESKDAVDALSSRVEMHRRLGVDTSLVDKLDLLRLFPRVSFEGVARVAFEPASGYADPVLASQGFARRAREKGAKFDTGTLVKRIVQERGHVTEVSTTTGSIQSPIVIVTAGAGAEKLLAPLGVSLDLRGLRGVIGFYEQPPSLYDGHPTVLDLETCSFLRPHAFHLSAAGITNTSLLLKPADVWDETVKTTETQTLSELTARRVPLLDHAPLKRAHAILYDRMPDGYPVLGAVPGTAGLYIAAGFGEDTLATAPAVGHALAELVVDGRAGMDLQEFRLARQTITHVVEGG
jgi:sarcosine oxidase subunit beta